VLESDHFFVVANMCWRRTKYERKEDQLKSKGD
jgi:hypothetical protein